MKPVIYILWGLALAALIATLFMTSMIWVAGPLLGLALSLALFTVFLYRPPEDHLGVIYRFARLVRLVADDDWVLVIPGIHDIKEPISLHVRQLDMDLLDVLSQDRIPVDCKLAVFYRRDLRVADPQFRSQALRISEAGWESVVKTAVQETASQALGSMPLQRLLTPTGRDQMKRTLGLLLSRRLERFGLLVNPRTGVSLQVVKPADAVWKAMIEQFAAELLGEAARARVRPILEELGERHPEIAWEALLLEWAGVIARDGAVPQVLVAPGQVPAAAAFAGRSQPPPQDKSSSKGTPPGKNRRREIGLDPVYARISNVIYP